MTRNNFRRFAMLLTIVVLATVGAMVVSSADDGGWQATYWNNTELEGNPVLSRNERVVDYNWGDGSPAPGTVNADNFSARWTQTVNLQQGTWRFILSSDDGSRLLVNGQRILDQWYDHSLRTTSAEIYLPGGDTQLTLEYFDRSHAAIASLRYDLLKAGGNAPQPTAQPTPWPTPIPAPQVQAPVQQVAQPVAAKPVQQAAVAPAAQLSGTITSCSNVGYTANYYNNRNLSGTPVINRTDPSINFDWGQGSPAAGVNSDNFSVRWNGNVDLKSGSYLMAVTGDDGLRLFINNTARVNDWIEQPLTTRTFNYEHAGGPLNIRVEHFEAAGYAKVGFSCVRLSDYTGPPRAQAQPVAQPVAQQAAQQQAPAPTPWPTAQPVVQPVAQPQPTAVPQQVAKAPAPVPATASSCIISRVYRLNVRSGPGLSYAIQTVVAYGEVVGLTGERQGKYLKIVTPNKQVGWINTYYCGSAELPADNAVAAAPAPVVQPVAQPAVVAPPPVAPEPVVVVPEPIPVPAQTGCNEVIVTSEALMIRGGPDVENLWYDIAYGSQTLCLTGARNNAATWVEVISPNGVRGWVFCAWTTISYDQLYALNPIQ